MVGTAFVAGCSPVPRAYYDSATKAGNEALVKEYEEADVVLAPVARKVMVRSGNACAAPSLISTSVRSVRPQGILQCRQADDWIITDMQTIMEKETSMASKITTSFHFKHVRLYVIISRSCDAY